MSETAISLPGRNLFEWHQRRKQDGGQPSLHLTATFVLLNPCQFNLYNSRFLISQGRDEIEPRSQVVVSGARRPLFAVLCEKTTIIHES